MTLVHIVIVKFKPETAEETKEIVIKDMLALKDTIPFIKRISAGKNFTDKGKGYEYGWVIEFESKEDLPIYSAHEAHQSFVAKHRPNLEDLLAFDYEA